MIDDVRKCEVFSLAQFVMVNVEQQIRVQFQFEIRERRFKRSVRGTLDVLPRTRLI